MTQQNIDGPRACTKSELPEVIALVDDEMRKGSAQSMLTDYPLVYQQSNLQNIYIQKMDGRLVSVVPFIAHDVAVGGCGLTIGIISPTVTHIDYRKNGYATMCLRKCVDKMISDDVDLSILWTNIETFPFYENTEFQGVRGQAFIYSCSREDAQRFNDIDCQVEQYESGGAKYIDEIKEMHESDGNGVLRSCDEYKKLLDLPGVKTLIAVNQSRAVAYLVASEAINKPGILEGGGEVSFLEALLHKTLSRLDNLSHLNAHVSLEPTVLGNLLVEKMPSGAKILDEGMMIRIIDVKGFFSRISGWLKKKNGSTQRSFSLGVTTTGEQISFDFTKAGLLIAREQRDTHLELSLRQLTSIVFGAHPCCTVVVPNVLSDLFPFYFPIPPLDHS